LLTILTDISEDCEQINRSSLNRINIIILLFQWPPTISKLVLLDCKLLFILILSTHNRSWKRDNQVLHNFTYVRKVRRSKVTTVHCKLTSGVMTVTK